MSKLLLRKGNEGERDVNLRAVNVNFGGVVVRRQCDLCLEMASRVET